MWFQKTGKVSDDFYVVGSSRMPVYLLDSSVPVLFDAGLTAFAEIYVRDIKKILQNRPPGYLFLTHAHFDHIGAAGYFKRIWPDLKIAGSVQSRDIIARPGAVKAITALNMTSIDLAIASGLTPIIDTPFEPFTLDTLAGPEQLFDIGPNLTVQALHTPGHTRDFTTYWIAAKKILVASEAVGCQGRLGHFNTEFLVNYDSYLDNIFRLSKLDADVLCPGHELVLTGGQVKAHLNRSLEHAREYLVMTEGFLRETKGDIDSTTVRIKAAEWDPRPWPKQIEQAYLLNTRQRVQTVWERMQASEPTFISQ
jgi:glyoxylase-like metal-dependent hydrolase (beta-lactamase superfamily II)